MFPLCEIAAAFDEAQPLISPIEFRPYEVGIELASNGQSTSEALRTRLAAELPMLIQRSIGGRWNVHWLPKPEVKHTALPVVAAEDRAESAVVPARVSVDVQYRIEISAGTALATATVDAFEPLWNYRSPRVELRTADHRELTSLVVATLSRLFRPRAHWDRGEDDQVRLRVQGAAFAVPDPALPLLHQPEVFEPWILFRNRDGSVRQAAPIPFTLFILNAAQSDEGVARIESGLRNPLTSRPRGRVELMAVASRSVWPATELELLARSAPPRQLVAHDVTVQPGSKETEPDESMARLHLISDRRGLVRISPVEEAPWVTATVASGDQTLAIVPLVPGSTQSLRLELPDDQLRLRVEGQLQLVQSQLVAIVAERTALMLATRAAAKRANWIEVETLIKDVTSLPSVARLREQVSGIRVPAVAQAREQKDSLTERRINRLCDETEALIERYLSDNKVKLLEEEMIELKAAATDAEMDKSR